MKFLLIITLSLFSINSFAKTYLCNDQEVVVNSPFIGAPRVIAVTNSKYEWLLSEGVHLEQNQNSFNVWLESRPWDQRPYYTLHNCSQAVD